MKLHTAIALCVAGLILAGCAQRQTRQTELETLRYRCATGESSVCDSLAQDCLNGELGSCKALCRSGDKAGCADYKRMLCQSGGPCQ